MATATKTRVASDDPYKLEKLLLLPYSALVVSADGSLLRVVGVHGLGRYTGASDGGGGGNKAVAGGGHSVVGRSVAAGVAAAVLSAWTAMAVAAAQAWQSSSVSSSWLAEATG